MRGFFFEISKFHPYPIKLSYNTYMARSFRLSDFSILMNTKSNGVYSHIAPNLTWGEGLISLGAILSPLANTFGVLTAIDNEHVNETTIIAQTVHRPGTEVANFTFFSPLSTLPSPAFNRLIEYLIKKLGKRKAHSVIAEISEDAPILEALRQENFSMYARQQIWELKTRPKPEKQEIHCRWLAGLDAINVHRLYNRIVPHLIQSFETGPLDRLRGVVCYRNNVLAGYADVTSGPWGIWAQPFISINESNPQLILAEIMNLITPRSWRPVYVCVRTYQSHLGQLLQNLGAKPGPKQVLVARRLTSTVQKSTLASIPHINGSREATTPYSHPLENKK